MSDADVVDPNAPVTGPVVGMDYFMSLTYEERICPVVERFAAELMEGRITGHKCPQCGLVYVPPRGYCPICVVTTTEADEIVAADRGVVTNYTIVTPVAYYGQEATEPFAKVSVSLDGGGSLSLQDVLDLPADEIRVGMRVEAVWVPLGERSTDDIGNRWGSGDSAIQGWRATGEPDVALADLPKQGGI